MPVRKDPQDLQLRPGILITGAASHFHDYLIRTRRPRNTIDSYLYDLKILADLLPELPINQISAGDITNYLALANAPATRKRRLTSIRRFFNYLISETETLTIDPTEDLYPNRIVLRIPEPLSPAQQIHLKEAAATDEAWSLLAIVLMMDCGLTRAELLGLDRGHLDRSTPDELRIHVIADDPARSDQERILVADSSVLAAYRQYLEARDPAGRLFTVGFQAINGMVNRVRRIARLERTVTPRTLRETYIMMRVLRGASEDELIRELGLADEYRNRQSLQRFYQFANVPASGQ